MEEKGLISQGVQGGFASIASAFVIESLEHMIPWLIVMFAIIMTDLFFGIRKSLVLDMEIRWSKAARITMGKIVTYFAFVVTFCMINVATENAYHIDKWACLLVCLVEGISIVGNYLKTKGIILDTAGALRLFCHKVTSVDKDDLKEIIKEEEKDGKETTERVEK